MERLTERHGDTVRLKGRSLAEASTADIVKMAERLATYEDTCLEPWQADAAKGIVEMAFEDKPERAERIRDLMRADKEGRVVVLPCKVGETAYYLNGPYIIDFEVIGYHVDERGAWCFMGEHYDPNTAKTYYCDPSTDKIGESVFLKKEEAEKMLEDKNDKKTGEKVAYGT